jgi:hypothetical protein
MRAREMVEFDDRRAADDTRSAVRLLASSRSPPAVVGRRLAALLPRCRSDAVLHAVSFASSTSSRALALGTFSLEHRLLVPVSRALMSAAAAAGSSPSPSASAGPPFAPSRRLYQLRHQLFAPQGLQGLHTLLVTVSSVWQALDELQVSCGASALPLAPPLLRAAHTAAAGRCADSSGQGRAEQARADSAAGRRSGCLLCCQRCHCDASAAASEAAAA